MDCVVTVRPFSPQKRGVRSGTQSESRWFTFRSARLGALCVSAVNAYAMMNKRPGTKTKVAVTSIFPLVKRQWLYAHLDGFDWDFPVFGPVLLRVGDETIRMRHAGFANVEGTAALQLVPADPRYPTVQDVVGVLGAADASGLYRPAGAFVERANGHSG